MTLGSTLASNINLNGGGNVEFGQGVTQTTACDNDIQITPYSNFVNTSEVVFDYGYPSSAGANQSQYGGVVENYGQIFSQRTDINRYIGFDIKGSGIAPGTTLIGAEGDTWTWIDFSKPFIGTVQAFSVVIPSKFAFTSVNLSDVDTTNSGCKSKAFTLKLYNQSGSVIATYSISYIGGHFISTDGEITETGNGTTTSSVTLTLTSSIIEASDVFRVTVESAGFTCESGGDCAIGDKGPGGGIVYYVSEAGFACGPEFTNTGSPLGGKCHYLEAARTTGTDAWIDGTYVWSGNTNTFIGTTETAIGSGYLNTLEMVAQSNTANRAGTISRAYRGPNDLSDWYLPSKDELNLLYLNKDIVGADEGYWSSSEKDAITAWDQGFGNGNQGEGQKTNGTPVRPIRSF